MIVCHLQTGEALRTPEDAYRVYGRGSDVGEHLAAILKAGGGPVLLVQPEAPTIEPEPRIARGEE